MADEPIVKQTLVQKLLFYTTAFFILLGTFSLFAFLFLVPFVIDPAFTTIFMQFEDSPAVCVTYDVVKKRGTSNCTWSSCKEGCTKELYECTQILVNYKILDDVGGVDAKSGSAKQDNRQKRSLFENSLMNMANMFAGETQTRESRAIRDYDYTSELSDDEFSLSRPQPTGLMGNDSEWYFTGARLFPNVKGCGYPPILNCSIFLKTYREIGSNYSCYFSRIDPSLVISDFDIRQVYMNLVYAMAIPIPSFIVSIIYLTFAYFVIYAEEPVPRAPPDAPPGATPVPPPTSGALTPASEVFREDLASFGHDFKVAMADEASRESVATCTDAVPNSNSIPDG